MTTCLKLDLHPNSFSGSTNRLWKEATLCESNPLKHEKSCLTGTFIVLEKVYNYLHCNKLYILVGNSLAQNLGASIQYKILTEPVGGIYRSPVLAI